MPPVRQTSAAPKRDETTPRSGVASIARVDAPRAAGIRSANPYVAGNQVGGTRAFVGREDILDAVARVLDEPQHHGLVLYGQRRIGKTSILHHLAATLPARTGHHPVYFDLQDKAAASLDEVLVELASEIAMVLGLADPVPGANVQAWFRDVWLPAVFGGMERDAALVVLFDEFDVLSDAGAKRAASAFFPYFRQLLDASAPRLRAVFVIGRNIDDVENVAHALFKSLPAWHVSLLGERDAEALVRLSEASGSLLWSDEAVAEAWSLTHGHPLLLQMLCWNVCSQRRARERVTVDDLQGAIDTTLTASRNAFEWLWKGLPAGTRVVAAALAQVGPQVVSEEEIHHVLHEGGVRVIVRELREAPKLLVEWDLLETPAAGKYRFRVELLRRMIARHKPPARVQEDLDLLEPTAENMYRAGEGLFKVGDLAGAKSELRGALRLNPNHVRASELLADVLIAEKDWSEARDVLEKLYEGHPALARARLCQVLLAQAELAYGASAKLRLYERVLGIDARNQEAGKAIRELWKKDGDEARAIQDIERARDGYTKAGLSETEIANALLEIYKATAEREKRHREEAARKPKYAVALGATLVAAGLAYGWGTARIEVSESEVVLLDKSEVHEVAATRVRRIGLRAGANGIVWSSASPAVATVDPDGTIKPVGTGHTRIEARDGALSANVEVTVSLPARIVVDPPDVTLTPNKSTAKLHASILDGTGAAWKGKPDIVWFSSDERVVKIVDGAVERTGAGTANARAQFGNLAGSVTIVSLSQRDALQEGCDKGAAADCHELSGLYAKGKNAPKDLARAFVLVEKACAGGAIVACVDLGIDYHEGIGVAVSYDKARAAYEKACNKNTADGCGFLGGMYEDGQGASRDIRKAIDLYRRGCEANVYGCARLGVLYERGNGVERAISTAITFYEKPCGWATWFDDWDHLRQRDKSRACANLARIYWRGEGAKKDPVRALEAYKEACIHGDADSCMFYGDWRENSVHDHIDALRYFWAACEAGDKKGCQLAPEEPPPPPADVR